MNNTDPIILFGAGGHAKVVLETIRRAGGVVSALYDDDPALQGKTWHGIPVTWTIAELSADFAGRGVICIGSNKIRQQIVKRFPRMTWVTCVHPQAVVAEGVSIGPGSVVFAGAVIQPGAVIGAHVIINTGATVDHDCWVGDFAHLAPGSHLGGTVTLGEGVFCGIGSGVIPGKTIGAWATLGAGAVAVRDIPAGVTAVGVPARVMERSGSRAVSRTGSRLPAREGVADIPVCSSDAKDQTRMSGPPFGCSSAREGVADIPVCSSDAKDQTRMSGPPFGCGSAREGVADIPVCSSDAKDQTGMSGPPFGCSSAALRNRRISPTKRLFDLLLVLVSAPFWLPLLGVLALLVRVKLGGPVFFRQERPGLRGRPFTILKFRTMLNSCDAGGNLLPDAERLTPFGNWLRSSSLDEIPELLNVLRGDMSLVGPRPLLMRYLDRYTPEQARRHDLLPGITGWAQINGRNAVTWDEKFRMDVWYVDHRTLALDLKILFLTIWKVFRRQDISAEGHVTSPEFLGTQKATLGESAICDRLIPASDKPAWMKALGLCGEYDTYHRAPYHQLAEEMDEGKAYLFFFQRNGQSAAFPFLLRPIAEIEGLETSRHTDITSVYGYPGIVTSVKAEDAGADEFRAEFQAALLKLLQQLSVVSLFSRTNPLLCTNWLFQGMAEVRTLGPTVVIDLSLSEDEQVERMATMHKNHIRKARKLGVVVEEDPEFAHLDEFMRIYNDTMKRNGARACYYFPREYYVRLKARFGDSLHLYFARYNGQAVSASMFFMTGHIIQYHLSGSAAEFPQLNGAKVILDEVRRIGSQRGFAWLHLGGGVGSSEDNLFRFKAGFSPLHLPFEVVRMVVDAKVYAELSRSQAKVCAANHGMHPIPDPDFFPTYRQP